jgi:hypothetical protein
MSSSNPCTGESQQLFVQSETSIPSLCGCAHNQQTPTQ